MVLMSSSMSTTWEENFPLFQKGDECTLWPLILILGITHHLKKQETYFSIENKEGFQLASGIIILCH